MPVKSLSDAERERLDRFPAQVLPGESLTTRSREGGCRTTIDRGEIAVTTTATIRVPGLKVTVPLPADALPRDLVPMDGPAGEPVLDLVLERSELTLRARINGKNYRKLLKQVAEHGADRMAVALQGVLRPPAEPGGPYILEGAGFQAVVKAAPPRTDPTGDGPDAP